MPKVTIATDDLTVEVEKDYKLINLCEDHDTSILLDVVMVLVELALYE